MVPFDPSPLFAKEPAEEERHPWLLILSDLMSLLVTFFVLLFALSFVSEGKWKTLVYSLSRRETVHGRAVRAGEIAAAMSSRTIAAGGPRPGQPRASQATTGPGRTSTATARRARRLGNAGG